MKHGFIKAAVGVPHIRVADTAYNAAQIITLMRQAQEKGVKILALPELCLTGCTCGDLFLQSSLLDGVMSALMQILTETAELDVLCAFGMPLRAAGRIFNCAVVIHRGDVLAAVPKKVLHSRDPRGEARVFTPGGGHVIPLHLPHPDGGELYMSLGDARIEIRNVPGLTLGIEFGDELFSAQSVSRRLAQAGATVILNLSAVPAALGLAQKTQQVLLAESARLHCAYLFAGAGKGESSTDLVFDGGTYIAENGEMLASRRFETGLLITEIDAGLLTSARLQDDTFPQITSYESSYNETCFDDAETVLTRKISRSPYLPEDEADRAACCEEILTLQSLGLAKRMEHIGAKKLVLGVSGGLDSTLAALVCARTLDTLVLPRENLLAVTMPCFGTTQRTKGNAENLAEGLGASLQCVNIAESVRQHFADIGHDEAVHNAVFENAQARERTQVLMDLANGCGGIVVGTGDLSELSLGWCTYNGDHMCMYGVNGGVPKTMLRHVVSWYADTCGDAALAGTLRDILDTPVSPELLPAENGSISQKTEDLVGPYELHDFFIYYLVRHGFAPDKILRMAKYAFSGNYDEKTVAYWFEKCLQRFFTQQFKRSCSPDGAGFGAVSLSPRGGWQMPSDASGALWLPR